MVRDGFGVGLFVCSLALPSHWFGSGAIETIGRIFLVCLACVCYLIPRFRRKWWRRSEIFKNTWEFLVATFVALVLAGLYYLILPFSEVVGRALLFLCLAVAASLVSREILWWLRFALAPRRMFPPGAFLPAEWASVFQEADPRLQKELLLRTAHRSMNLEPEGFLGLLTEVETHVRWEPALSTYWDRRDQLEQALRQERQG